MINDFKELFRAGARPLVVVMMGFTFMWITIQGMIPAREALPVIGIVIAYLFGERKAGKS